MKQVELTGKAKKFFEEVVLQNNPKMTVRLKADSFRQRAIGLLFWLFNPFYMTRYITVLGDTIWLPAKVLSEHALFEVLVHENVHIKQKNKYGAFLYSLAYLFPLTLIFLGIPLAIFVSKWFLLLAGLSLAPLPAAFRFYFEVEAYRTTLILMRDRGVVSIESLTQVVAWVVEQLSTKLYYFTWPFKKHIEKVLLDEALFNKPIYSDLYWFIRNNKN